MPKITPKKKEDRAVVYAKTVSKKKPERAYNWWKARSKEERSNQLIETAGYLKENQQYRYRQANIWSRLYSNTPLFSFAGSSTGRMNISQTLPMDRPTMNVVGSNIDTLVSRISQNRPRPVFLTDNGDYKERNLAKKLNMFLMGEFYQLKAYERGPLILRDAAALGTGCLKIYESMEKKVAVDRVLYTELMVDPNDAMAGYPRTMYQFKLIDREVAEEMFSDYRSKIESAEQSYPDDSGDSQKTTSDQIMIVEGWRLPSYDGADDGYHSIACTSGELFGEKWTKSKFPFVFLRYEEPILGFWGRGISEQLMGTQVEINKLLMTISKSIALVGIPRVFIEDGSKIVKSNINNEIGNIITFRGTPPIFNVAECVPQELYAQLQRLIEYSYQQTGVSALAAAAQKPAGLNSGEAIRNYDDLQSDRFAALVRRYDNMFIDLAYQVIDLAKEIAERDGEYQTVYPNKNSAKEVDLPDASLLEDPFVIQCFDSSSLPRDPAGRLQKITEMMQAGIIDPAEGRRLLDYPDLEQTEVLANAGEERILQILDCIIEDGEYSPPDPFMDIQLARKLVTQYYNLYAGAKLEESRQQMLRTFASQLDNLSQAAMPPQAQPQAVPQGPPTSDLLPNVAGQLAS